MTAQCIVKGRRLVLIVLPAYSLQTAAESMPKIVEMCTDAGVSIRRAMLDREFFSAEALNHLPAGVPYIIPCINTFGVVEALRDYDAGRRKRVSWMMLENDSETTSYFMTIIRRRKRQRGRDTGRWFIDFATNRWGIDVEMYSGRWGNRDSIPHDRWDPGKEPQHESGRADIPLCLFGAGL